MHVSTLTPITVPIFQANPTTAQCNGCADARAHICGRTHNHTCCASASSRNLGIVSRIYPNRGNDSNRCVRCRSSSEPVDVYCEIWATIGSTCLVSTPLHLSMGWLAWGLDSCTNMARVKLFSRVGTFYCLYNV